MSDVDSGECSPKRERIERALEDAFLAGFRASCEGYNGEIVAHSPVQPWDDEYRETDGFKRDYTEWRESYELSEGGEPEEGSG